MLNKENSMKRLLILTLAALLSVAGLAAPALAQTFPSVQVLDGRLGAPSYTFYNDTDTGLYRKSANTIGIVAGGTEIGTISATGLNTTVGNVQINQSDGRITATSATYSDSGSRQVFAGDLTVGAAVGGSAALSERYLAGMMGNLISTANLTNTRNNMAGVWGKYTITGTNASVLAKGGVVGECAATSCDAAIIAVISDGEGATVAPRAFYSVDWQTGSFPNSRPDFGLDLLGPGQRGEFDSGTYGKCDIRLSGNAYICTTALVTPVNGASGTLATIAVHGSLLIALGGDTLYINTGTLASPTWTRVGSQ